MFQLWVQEGAAASALATSHPESVAESLLNVGNVIVRCQDTSRGVQVVKPLVRDLSVAEVLNPMSSLSSWGRSLRVRGMQWSGVRHQVPARSKQFAAKHRLPPELPSEHTTLQWLARRCRVR